MWKSESPRQVFRQAFRHDIDPAVFTYRRSNVFSLKKAVLKNAKRFSTPHRYGVKWLNITVLPQKQKGKATVMYRASAQHF